MRAQLCVTEKLERRCRVSVIRRILPHFLAAKLLLDHECIFEVQPNGLDSAKIYVDPDTAAGCGLPFAERGKKIVEQLKRYVDVIFHDLLEFQFFGNGARLLVEG